MTDKLLPDIIQPEGLEIAEAYLTFGGDSKRVSTELSIPIAEVDAQLKKGEVRSYINRQFNETGFRNKHRIFGVMDQLLNMKLEEIQETEVGTSVDIVDLIKVMHKMKMDEMKMEVDLEKAKAAAGPAKQTNVQINNGMAGGDDENYLKLLNVLAG